MYDAISDVPPAVLETYLQRAARPRGQACLIWNGQLDRKGYGRVIGRDGSRRWYHVSTHRLAYLVNVGSIPAGLVLDHTCMNRACYNFRHLEPVTNAENLRRAKASRLTCGNGHSYTEHGFMAKSGRRFCRVCVHVNQARWRAKVAARCTAST